MNYSYGGDEASTTIMAKVLYKGVQFLGHGFDFQKKKKKFPSYRKWEQRVSKAGPGWPSSPQTRPQIWSLALPTVQTR